VYIPLGGNRKGMARTCLNITIVFLLTGLWHGANYTFLVWGAAFAVFMVLERLFLGKLLEKNKFKLINRLYTLLVVMLLFAFFRAGSIAEAFETIKIMFSFRGGTYPLFQAISLEQWLVLVAGILLCGPVQKWFGPWWNKVRNKTVSIWVDYTFQFCLYFVCVNLLLNNSFNPFIYFQF
jgi:alginate O-acetyltransferase complex protein AlgI